MFLDIWMQTTYLRQGKLNMTVVYLEVLVLSFFHLIISGIQGQDITPSSVVVAVGDDVSLECTTTASNPSSFVWLHVSTGVQIYVGGIKFPPSGDYDNFDLDEDTTAKRSTLIINSILMQDAGQYRCSVSGQADVDPTTVTVEGMQGQVITPSSVVVAVYDDVSLECTTTALNPFSFAWIHVSTGVQLYVGGIKYPPSGEYYNFDLDEDTTAKRSTLIINSIMMQDAGQYRCSVSGQADVDPTTVTVEVGSASQPIALTSIDVDINYQATCEAIGSSPEETITWILDGVPQSNGIEETNPQITDDSLFDKRSVFTFPATIENFNVQLECNISGHQVAELNRQETRLLDIHNPPVPGGIIIGFTSDGAELTVSCDTNKAVAPAVPVMSTFNIYSNGALITKPDSDNTVTITQPEQDTEFTCIGSNYLGDTITTTNFVHR